MRRTGLLCITAILLFSACRSTQQGEETPVPEVEAQMVEVTTPPTIISTQPTLTPLPEDAPIDSIDSIHLTIWATDVFVGEGQSAFTDKLTEFDSSFPNIQVEIFTKRGDGPGGMLDYVRTAEPVAPTVLPDLILVNRETLLRAVNEGMIVPFGQVEGSDRLGVNFYPVAEELATVGGQMTGVPYVLTTEHTVYRTTLFADVVPNEFGLLLEQNTETPVPFTFAAGPVTGVSRTLLAQYLAAGGTLATPEGDITLDAEPLTEVLTFYADANEAGIINPGALFQYATSDEVWTQYLNGQVSLAVVPSRSYLLQREEVRSTGLTTIPTTDGEPVALVEGLYWALVTREPEQQAASMELIKFLLNPINQGELTQDTGWLPSQPSALTVWGNDDPYHDFADVLLENGYALPTAAVRTTAGSAIQQALEDVLLNGVLPAQAANAAVQTVTGDSEGN